jgi:hypothetical protein
MAGCPAPWCSSPSLQKKKAITLTFTALKTSRISLMHDEAANKLRSNPAELCIRGARG